MYGESKSSPPEATYQSIKTIRVHSHTLHTMRRRAHAPRPPELSTQAGSARSVIAAQAIRKLHAGWITV
jgi:hypothetical protein